MGILGGPTIGRPYKDPGKAATSRQAAKPQIFDGGRQLVPSCKEEKCSRKQRKCQKKRHQCQEESDNDDCFSSVQPVVAPTDKDNGIDWMLIAITSLVGVGLVQLINWLQGCWQQRHNRGRQRGLEKRKSHAN